MGHSTIRTCVHFITIITIVSGYGHEPNPNYKRLQNLQDTMTDLTRHPGLQFYPTKNIKRMTMDENARSRSAWGQMNSPYYQNPMPSPYGNYNYQNQGQPQGAYNYASTENYPKSTSPQQVINIYKADGKQMNGAQNQRQPNARVSITPLGMTKPQGVAGSGGGGGGGGGGGAGIKEVYDRVPPPSAPTRTANSGNKKVKVLICRLQQGSQTN